LEPTREKLIAPEKADFIKPFYWTEEALFILDQRKLPFKEIYFKADTIDGVRRSIRDMLVRGAPAIGIVTAIGVYIGLKEIEKKKKFPLNLKRLEGYFREIEWKLSTARPTAVNLFWALERMRRLFESYLLKWKEEKIEKIDKELFQGLLEEIKREALFIWEEDIKANLKIGELGCELLPEGGILTHCNTGSLATGGYGTALGVIRKAFEKGKKIRVFVDETRPYLQGARLTAWELSEIKIPYFIIPDNTAGFLMKKGLIKAVIVGADRIARNGDTANKIGTYSLAILAKHHGIPFYVCAPSSTFDLNIPSGEKISIEERAPKEVLYCSGKRIAPKKAKALNFAFDLTPSEYITAFITEKGIIYPPFEENILKLMKNG
jgi:methylthioribose-1-phosphate isomerase